MTDKTEYFRSSRSASEFYRSLLIVFSLYSRLKTANSMVTVELLKAYFLPFVLFTVWSCVTVLIKYSNTGELQCRLNQTLVIIFFGFCDKSSLDFVKVRTWLDNMKEAYLRKMSCIYWPFDFTKSPPKFQGEAVAANHSSGQETRMTGLSCGRPIRTFFRFVTILAFDRRTDRQTDGQTDRQTAFSWLYRALHYMQLLSHGKNCV